MRGREEVKERERKGNEKGQGRGRGEEKKRRGREEEEGDLPDECQTASYAPASAAGCVGGDPARVLPGNRI